MNLNGRSKMLLAIAAVGAGMGAAGAAVASETLTYGYDARGRLVNVGRSGSVNSGINTSYGYDKADNRTAVTVTGAPIVADASFEDPEVGSSYLYNPVVAGAVFAAQAAVAGNGSAWGFAAAPDGDQVGALRSAAAGTGAISQDVTGLTSGNHYQISFMLAQRAGYSLNPVTVSVDGTSLGTFTPPSTGFTRFTVGPFTAAGTTATITFTGTPNSGDAGSGLDQVSVQSVP